jgi:hypothetical protein
MSAPSPVPTPTDAAATETLADGMIVVYMNHPDDKYHQRSCRRCPYGDADSFLPTTKCIVTMQAYALNACGFCNVNGRTAPLLDRSRVLITPSSTYIAPAEDDSDSDSDIDA